MEEDAGRGGEGEKEGKERAQREEAVKRKEMLRRSLMMRKKRKTALLSEVDRGNDLNNPEGMNKEHSVIIDGTSNTTDMPNYASISQFGGEMVLHDQVIYGQSQDINDEEIYAKHQGF